MLSNCCISRIIFYLNGALLWVGINTAYTTEMQSVIVQKGSHGRVPGTKLHLIITVKMLGFSFA